MQKTRLGRRLNRLTYDEFCSLKRIPVCSSILDAHLNWELETHFLFREKNQNVDLEISIIKDGT